MADENVETTEQATTEAESTDTTTEETSQEDQESTSEQTEETESEGGDESADTEEKEEKPKGAAKAPENYEFAVPSEMPEDFSFDAEVEQTLARTFREIDLTQDDAQKLIDDVWPVLQRRAEQQEQELDTKWAELAKKDSRVGGEKLKENLATIERTIKAFDRNGLGGLLNTAWRSNPDFLALVLAAAPAVSEDDFKGGTKARKTVDASDDAQVAEVMYPDDVAASA